MSLGVGPVKDWDIADTWYAMSGLLQDTAYVPLCCLDGEFSRKGSGGVFWDGVLVEFLADLVM